MDTHTFHSLWTVGMTTHSRGIRATGGPTVYQYLVVFQLQSTPKSRDQYVTYQAMEKAMVDYEIIDVVPRRLENEQKIIGRVDNPGSDGYPDAYIFTQTAQEKHPLEVIRIYRFKHFDDVQEVHSADMHGIQNEHESATRNIVIGICVSLLLLLSFLALTKYGCSRCQCTKKQNDGGRIERESEDSEEDIKVEERRIVQSEISDE